MKTLGSHCSVVRVGGGFLDMMAFGCHDTAMTLPQACAHVKRNGRGNGNDDFSVQCTMYLQLQVVRFYIYPD